MRCLQNFLPQVSAGHPSREREPHGGFGRVYITTLFLFIVTLWYMAPNYSILARDTEGNDRENEVIEMMATQTKTSFSRTLIERIIPRQIKKMKLDDYKDDSIELRRYLAAESANRQFEQRKDRALTENHRAGFMR